MIVDGNDIFAVYEAAREAMQRARTGGPTLLECKTYRLRPHSNADNDMKYRTAEKSKRGGSAADQTLERIFGRAWDQH